MSIVKPLQILVVYNSIDLLISGVAASFFWITLLSFNGWLWPMLDFYWLAHKPAMSMQCVLGMPVTLHHFLIPLSYATLIFAAFYDFSFFGQIPDSVSILGGITIIAWALLLPDRERRAFLKETS